MRKGIHDAFEYYANIETPVSPSWWPDRPFAEVAYCRGNTVRLNVYWDVVQPRDDPNYWDWSWYGKVADVARRYGISVLPCLVGCPNFSWTDPHYNPAGVRFPGPGGLTAYANFAATTAYFFAVSGVSIAALEVWNEPNLINTGAWISRYETSTGQNITWTSHYRDMLSNVLNKLDATYGHQSDNTPNVWTLGGAVAFATGWQDFVSGIEQASCIPWGLSIHPYSGYAANAPTTDTRSFAVSKVVEQVMNKYDEARSLTGHGVWVTETGCPSKDPFNQLGQQEAIESIWNRLQDNSRNCKAMILYRLYDLNHTDRDTNRAYNKYPVLTDETATTSPARKMVCDRLHTIWA